MNANRMKYASTPTYGMQKRSLFKKPTAQKELETPDFSQAPETPAAIPPQPFSPTLFSMPQQAPFAQPPMQQPSASYQQSPYFSPVQPFAPTRQTAQIPFATPNFIQPGAQPFAPLQPMAGQGTQPPPLGNSAPAINPPEGGFSGRNQGYVPPLPMQQPRQSVPSQPMMQPAPSARPAVQPAPFSGGANAAAPLYGGAPFAGQSGQPFMGYGSAPVQQPASFYAPPAPMQPGSGMQSPAFTVRTPSQPKQRQPLDANKLWTVFLFGVLPLLFIPTLFVPSSLDFLRYLFIGLCVCGLGGMWYRQMYASSTRLIVSVVYVALCIVTLALMMRAGRDVQQVGANISQPQAAQATIAPDDSALSAVAAPTEVAVQDTPTPMQQGPSEAEQRLSTFMALWQGGNASEMVSYVQPSWASAQDNPSSQLFIVLANRTPEEFTIEDISGTDDDSSRTVTMTATINKNNGKEPSIYRFMVLMVKEGGEWYVDPNSLATNDQLTSNEENVVTSKDLEGMTTAAPRTTVTPVPPSDTKLYYNPDGGSFYHADPECPSVRKEYLPLPGSFLYSELGAHTDLQPCLKCGAPTQALSSDSAAQ